MLEICIMNTYGNIDTLKELRKKLNVNAELSFKEFNTQSIILDFLKDLDTKVLVNTGVTATLNIGTECIAVRADMDALSVNGVSHAWA